MLVWGLSALSLLAQNEKTDKFKVAGNCDMCKTRIEKAANSVEGVTSADWNKETKILEVSFSTEKADVHQIQMAIAEVGHDTPMHKAPDEVYDELPGCCKYERMSYTAHQH
jgi:mercuric ion binding protein